MVSGAPSHPARQLLYPDLPLVWGRADTEGVPVFVHWHQRPAAAWANRAEPLGTGAGSSLGGDSVVV